MSPRDTIKAVVMHHRFKTLESSQLEKILDSVVFLIDELHNATLSPDLENRRRGAVAVRDAIIDILLDRKGTS